MTKSERQKRIEALGARLDPKLREFVDRVIVPALVRECQAEKKKADSLNLRVVAHSEQQDSLREVAL